ncbi:NAD(P)H-hydrate dehydratase [Hymenobacter saemangeumensis]
MKILTAAQIRQLDYATVSEQGLSSVELMERAATAFTKWLRRRWSTSQVPEVLVLAGPGNNGGDGLAIARLLYQDGYPVRVGLLPAASYSADYLHNRAHLPKGVPVHEIGATPLELKPNGLVVDALFGTGLSRPLAEEAAAVVAQLNEARARVVAVDLPSGLLADSPQPADSPIVQASYTVSFGLPKLAFFLPQHAAFVGEWHVEDIGLSAAFIADAEASWFFTDASAAQGLLPARPPYAHKGTFGHALLLAGSRGKIGAALLATQACLRTGVGLLTVRVPGCGYEILQTAAPEAMCLADAHPDYLSELPDLSPYQAVGMGPGLGQQPASRGVLQQLLEEAANTSGQPLPLVLDADALNLLGQHRELLAQLPPDTVLTPHPKEFERLTERARDDYHRLELLQAFAREHRCYVVLKGAYSCLATPQGELHFNCTGNPGMATGGSGDVLTGLLTALRADVRLTAFAAVQLGVYAHGRAGDLAAQESGEPGLIASDIIRYIGPALRELTAAREF